MTPASVCFVTLEKKKERFDTSQHQNKNLGHLLFSECLKVIFFVIALGIIPFDRCKNQLLVVSKSPTVT